MDERTDHRGLVVELCGGDVAGSYCARMLHGVGFRVIKVEPPGGDPLRAVPPIVDDGRPVPTGALFQYLNAGKESVVAEAHSPLVETLLDRAEIVLLAADDDADRVHAAQAEIGRRRPSLVRVVTSGFGLTGPYRNLRHCDLADWAASGYMFITGDPEREPLQGGGPFPAYAAGLTATIGALAAWRDATAGQPGRLVDVGTFESMAALHQTTITLYTHQGFIKQRAGNRHAEAHHPVAFLECSDGWICLAAAGKVQWERLAEAVNMPELLTDPRFATAGERYEHADAVDDALRPWLMTHSAKEAAQILQTSRVPASRVRDLTDVLDDEHLQARGFLQSVDIGGHSVTMAGSAVSVGASMKWTAAPALGHHTASVEDEFAAALPRTQTPVAVRTTAMLEGVRVLDFTRAWAGPLAGRFLADLGADIIHVEYDTARAAGDSYDRRADPDWTWGELPEPALRAGVFPDGDPGPDPWNRQGYFNKLHRNKKSLSLDLHQPESIEILHKLVARSDVVLDNYSPRGARGLGIVHELLREINPRIVVVSLSGYGHTGPDHDRVALGPIVEAESGLAALTGYRRGGPTKLGAAMADGIAGLNGAIAVLAGLAERDLTGEGLFIDVSMLESFVAIGGDALLATSAWGRAPDRRGNQSPLFAPHGAYPCAGHDEWITIAVRDNDEWLRVVDAVAAPPLTDVRFQSADVRALEQPFLDRVIAAWTAGRSKWEAWHELRSRGVTAFPVLTNGDLVHDPQLASRGFLLEWDQPGIGPRLYPGFPITFDPHYDHDVLPSAALGADNRAILRDLLHVDATTIDDLERRRVLTNAPLPA